MSELEKEKEELVRELANCKKRLAELEKRLGSEDREKKAAGGGKADLILVVEDEEQVREMIQRVLEANGFNALVAKDAEQALKITRDQGARLQLVLTDIMMPGMSGAELARKLKTIRPELKVLFMSGYAEGPLVPHDVYDVIDQNSSIIQKPFSAEELLGLIREGLKT